MDEGNFPMKDLFVHNCVQVLAHSILYYDILLTFGDEVEFFWRGPKYGASWLFFVNRYFSFFANIAVGVMTFTPLSSAQSCRVYSLFRQIELIAAQVIVCAILFLRTYALYGRDKRILILVLSVSGVLFIVACWSITGGHSDVSIHYGCHTALSATTGIHIATAWEALFVFDLLIFALTLFKTYRERSRFLTGNFSELIELIFRDGAIYFAVMACANAANTLTFYLLPPSLKGSLSTFASGVSVTMMSRVMLNMRQTTYSMRPSTSAMIPPTTTSTSLYFTSRFIVPSRPYNVTRSEEPGEVFIDPYPVPQAGGVGVSDHEIHDHFELHQVQRSPHVEISEVSV